MTKHFTYELGVIETSTRAYVYNDSQDLRDLTESLNAMLEALQTIENWLSVSFVSTPQDMAQSFEEMYWIARHAIAKTKGQAE